MSDLLARATALEVEFSQLANAEELDDERIAVALEHRNTLHREIGAQIDANPSLLSLYQPYLKDAYQNTQQLQKRCEQVREDVQKKLIELNTSKKARKAY